MERGMERHGGYSLAQSDANAYSSNSRATLTYSACGYDSAVCWSKMSCDAFLSEALYEADKELEKFTAAPQ